MPSRRQAAFLRSIVFTVVGAIAIWLGASAVASAVWGNDAQAAAPWLALAKATSLAWVAAAGWLITWRRLDERERETRKFSWFVGSTAAILLTAPIVVFCFFGGAAFLTDLLGRRGTPGAFLGLGWVGLVIAQLLSSLVARVAQRLAKR